MSFALDELKAALRGEADQVERRLMEHLRSRPGLAPRLDEAISYSLLGGGKRLRPALCLWLYDALRPKRSPAVWSAAMALEMVHTYSLIHDDLPCMDDDDLRRGQPSNHRRFDEATAVLAGDTLQTEAFGLLSEVEPPALAVDLVRWLAITAGRSGMAAGQQLDLEASGSDPSAERMETLHALKTGRLLGAALAMGAVCGGMDPDGQCRTVAAGQALGVAFQIVDDLLDESASAAELGKSPGKDRDQGKLTAVSTLGAASARERAEQLLGEAHASLDELGVLTPRVRALSSYLVHRDR